MEEQGRIIAKQQAEIHARTSQMQKLNDRLDNMREASEKNNDEEFNFPDRQAPGDPAGLVGIAAVAFAPQARSRGLGTKQTRSASVPSRCTKRREGDSTGRLVRYSARDSRRNSKWSPGTSRRSSR